jgi:hypothetical protein
VLKAAPIARLGYRQYTHIDNVWEMTIPSMPDDNGNEAVFGGMGLPYEPSAKKAEQENEVA